MRAFLGYSGALKMQSVFLLVGLQSSIRLSRSSFLSEIMHANLARQFCQGNVAFPLETCLCPTPVVNNLPEHVQLLENMAANRFADISRVDIHR